MAEPFKSDHVCSPMNAMVCDLLRAETRSKHVTCRISSIARPQIVSVSSAPVHDDLQRSNIKEKTPEPCRGDVNLALGVKTQPGCGLIPSACVAWIDVGARDQYVSSGEIQVFRTALYMRKETI